jgi:hypothetical protein
MFWQYYVTGNFVIVIIIYSMLETRITRFVSTNWMYFTVNCWLVYSCCPNLERRVSVKRFVSLQFLNLRPSMWLLGRVIRPSQGCYLTQTGIYTSSGIRTHYPRVWASEDGSCLRPRGHCDRFVVEGGSLNTCLSSTSPHGLFPLNFTDSISKKYSGIKCMSAKRK